MTLSEVKARIIEIEDAYRVHGDDGKAAALEGNLRRDFLRHLTHVAPEGIMLLALEILKTENMDFRRDVS